MSGEMVSASVPLPASSWALQGWTCPVCKAGVSPYVSEHCRPAETQRKFSSDTAERCICDGGHKFRWSEVA